MTLLEIKTSSNYYELSRELFLDFLNLLIQHSKKRKYFDIKLSKYTKLLHVLRQCFTSFKMNLIRKLDP